MDIEDYMNDSQYDCEECFEKSWEDNHTEYACQSWEVTPNTQKCFRLPPETTCIMKCDTYPT